MYPPAHVSLCAFACFGSLANGIERPLLAGFRRSTSALQPLATYSDRPFSSVVTAAPIGQMK